MKRRYTLYYEGGVTVKIRAKYIEFDGRTLEWDAGRKGESVPYLSADGLKAIVRG